MDKKATVNGLVSCLNTGYIKETGYIKMQSIFS